MNPKDWRVVSVEVLNAILAEPKARKDAARQVVVHFKNENWALPRDFSPARAALDSRRIMIAVNRDELARLAQWPEIRSITLVEQLQPSMDRAAQMCALSEFKLTHSRSGSNVLIAIIDSGIDAAHPMFQGRIECIWDQTLAGASKGSSVPVGRLLQQGAFVASSDTAGHGTHVAGIAAGDDADFSGVAPGARLVIVKSTLKDSDIIQALNWLKDYATAANLPMVVNLSMEAFNDPRDGSGGLCETIDDVSGPGFIVCCASGNTGQDVCHAETFLSGGQANTLLFRVERAGSQPTSAMVKGWADKDALLECEFLDNQGHWWKPPTSSASPFDQRASGGVTLTHVFPKPEPGFGDATGFLLTLREDVPGALQGSWGIRIANTGSRSGSVHLWASPSESVLFHPKNATNRVKISAPGAASRAITVGALVTRTIWQDESGTVHHDSANRRFQVGSFSSPGPLRSGQRKPDLVAPGVHICSARATNAAVEPHCAVSSQYVVKAGSSMATPFIAGVVALMLEASPTLMPEEAKSQLTAVCAIPSREAGSFDDRWGYGFPELVLL